MSRDWLLFLWDIARNHVPPSAAAAAALRANIDSPAGFAGSEEDIATGSAAPQCGAAYPQNATLRSLARPRRTGVRRSHRPSGLTRVRSSGAAWPEL